MTVYTYTDDRWYDRESDLDFECFNAVGWEQNGSATSFHDLISQILLHYTADGGDSLLDFNPYRHLTFQEIKTILHREGVIVRELK